jgi:hypothetical protein
MAQVDSFTFANDAQLGVITKMQRKEAWDILSLGKVN